MNPTSTTLFKLCTDGAWSPGKYLKSLPEENDLRWFVTTELVQSLKGFDKVACLKFPIIY